MLTHAQLIGFYPLSLVALFIGPPLGILTHVYSLRNLATAARADATDTRRDAAAVERHARTVGHSVRTT